MIDAQLYNKIIKELGIYLNQSYALNPLIIKALQLDRSLSKKENRNKYNCRTADRNHLYNSSVDSLY